jgi:glycosyltransferase involved in cell wall biosynthesis
VLKEETLYFESENSNSLAGQLEWWLKNQAKAQRISKNAQVMIQKEFSWNAISSRYVQLYRSVVRNSHKPVGVN